MGVTAAWHGWVMGALALTLVGCEARSRYTAHARVDLRACPDLRADTAGLDRA